MIQFKEINGQLCLMLEKPIPLTADAKFPCVVRLIQDSSPMGRYNNRLTCKCLLPFICIGIDNKGDMERMENAPRFGHECYEILGYPVADHSAEWALWRMMQGDKVCNVSQTWNAHSYKDGNILFTDGMCQSADDWLIWTASNGWQIYAEKPLLADAKEGDKVRHRNGKISRITDIESVPAGITGGWTTCIYTDLNMGMGCSLTGKAALGQSEYDIIEIIVEKQDTPLLAEAKVGDLCQRRDGTYTLLCHTQILERPLEKRYSFEDAKGSTDVYGKCLSQTNRDFDIISTEPLAAKGTAGWAWQMNKLLGKKVMHPYSNCITDGNITRDNKDTFLAVTFPTGWQLYEPKPEPPREPEYVICKRCAGSQSVPNPVVSNTAYTTCPKCGGTGYEIREQKPDNLYLNIKPSNPADWCFDKKNLLVLVDDNFKGIVGENVTREQVGEIAKLLTEPAPQYKVGDWVRGKSGYAYGITAYPSKLLPDNPNVYDAIPASCMDGPSLCLELSDIESKLDPSDVRVKITLEGTVRHRDQDTFYILTEEDDDIRTCDIISYTLLDPATAALVRELIEKQEENNG